MSRAAELARLQALAAMVREARQAALARAMAAREDTRARIAALDRPDTTLLDPLAEAQAVFRYGRWADARRAELNLALARETARWAEARGGAATATARAEVIGEMAAAERQARARAAARRAGDG